MIQIGLIGDRDDMVPAHEAIPRALDLAAASQRSNIEPVWLPTDELCVDNLGAFDGLWCVPASPYRDTSRVISAIRYARENRIPFLGTCGGFQHAIIEYARNVLNIKNAHHAELQSNAEALLISPLACELVEKTEQVRFVAGSLLRDAYGCALTTEGYHCRYGLNPEFSSRVASGAFEVAAIDAGGAIRAMELRDHPFFVITLFQPERAALGGTLPPIVNSFAKHCLITAEPRSVARPPDSGMD